MSGRAVPVGRRFLFVERRRAVLAVLGVAASLLLVLLLTGIFAGAIDRVTYYIRTSPADVFVSQGGVRTMHMSSSVLPSDAVARVAGCPVWPGCRASTSPRDRSVARTVASCRT